MFIWQYFEDFYIEFQLPSMPISELTLLLCMIVLFNKLTLELKIVGKVALHLLIVWPLTIVFKACFYSSVLYNPTYLYFPVILVYGLIVGRKNIKNTFVYILVYWAACVYASSFAKAAGAVFFKYFLNAEITAAASYVFCAYIISIVLIAFTVLMKAKPLDRFKNPVSTENVMLTFLVSAISTGAKAVVDSIKAEGLPFFDVSETQNALLIFSVGTLIYVLNTLVYYFCYKQGYTKDEEDKRSHDIESIKSVQLEKHDEELLIQSGLEEIRTIRHDIKNQMAYMQIMLSQKDYGRLEEYLNEYNKGISPTLNYSDCENTTVRNVINLESYKAKQEGITINTKIIVPARLSIADSDLTALLLNLLDNAIEACIEDTCQNCVIEFNMQQNDNYLFINVVNPLSDSSKMEKRKKLITLKENGTIHGRGTKVISSIAAKYNGTFVVNVEMDKFTADVMLALIR